MASKKTVLPVLKEMAELMEVGAEASWTAAIRDWQTRWTLADKEAGPVLARKVLRSFGGLGSLNDIVLYKDGKPMNDENARLDHLRTELFDLCMDTVAAVENREE